MIDEKGNKVYCASSGKVCYTLRESGEVLNSLKVHRNGRYFRKKECPKRRYYCRDCGYYHLTHWRCYRDDLLIRGTSEGGEKKQA